MKQMPKSPNAGASLIGWRRAVGRLAILGICVWLLFYFTKKTWMLPTGIAVAATCLLLGATFIWEFVAGNTGLSKDTRTVTLLKLSRALFQVLALGAVIYSILGHAWSQAVVLGAGMYAFITIWINSELTKRGAAPADFSWTAPLFGRKKCPLCWGVSAAIIVGLCVFIAGIMLQSFNV